MEKLIRLIAKHPASLSFCSKLAGFVLRKGARYAAQLVLACDEEFANFVDAQGKRHPLLSGLRDALKPDWRKMFTTESAVKPLSRAEASARLAKYRLRAEALVNYLATSGLSLSGRRVLEIGAGDGATAYALAERGPAAVVASDIAKYYLNQEARQTITADAIARKNEDLALMRRSFEPVYQRPANAPDISFVEDDMTATGLAAESFDAVVSWEVLEHFSDPRRAFAGMAHVLKPGGYAFHEYNPFFSLVGGHSLCTLDFLWGHARLSETDFTRYVETLRPQEAQVAQSFFTENLNRMCLADLRDFARDAGLDVIDLVPYVSEVDSRLLTEEVITDSRRYHPSVCFQDFVCPRVWVLLRKG